MHGNLGPVIFFCTVTIGLLLLYERRKRIKNINESHETFWDNESKANSVRKKDISFLNYVNLVPELLPLENPANEEIERCQSAIKNLCGKKILNLSSMCNTELKLEYGAANLPSLSEYEDNYTNLITTLNRLAEEFIAVGNTADARVVLEYAISIDSDISRTYYMLADIYKNNNEPEKIDELIQKAESIKTIMKDSIIKKLSQIRGYCNQ